MALFKILKGSESNLPNQLREGYMYFTTDLHNLFVDFNAGTKTQPNLKRVQINAKSAQQLLKEDSEGNIQYIEFDDIVTIDDIIGVEQGGTGLQEISENAVLVGNNKNTIKIIPTKKGVFQANSENSEPIFDIAGIDIGGTGGTTQQEARDNLDIYSKIESDSAVYTTILTADGWTKDGDYFEQSWSEPNLVCGNNGNIPPEINYITNRKEYSLIENAEATPRIKNEDNEIINGTIVFKTKIKPVENIEILIIDRK